MKKKYLLNVKFYAGSDEPEDIDTGLYLFITDKEVSKEQMTEIFRETNKLLDCFDYEEKDFPISYEYGLNINTLIMGIKYYTKSEIVRLRDNYGNLDYVDNYYEIEQWA